jgi:signal transduction histidine kinase
MARADRSRWSAWVAWALALSCLGLVAALTAIGRLNHTSFPAFVRDHAFTIVFALVFPFTGALIASRHPRNPVGWLMIAAPLFAAVQSVADAYARHALVVSPGSLPGGAVASWIYAWAWTPLIWAAPLLFLLIPDGRPPSPRWRWVLYVGLGGFALEIIGFMATWSFRGALLLKGPDKLPHTPLLTKVAFGTFPIYLFWSVAAVAAIVVRFKRSRGEERQQLKWITYGVVLGGVDTVINSFHGLPSLVDAIAIVPLALAIAAAILKYRLYDIDLVINKTVVYGSMAAFITAVYVAVVVGIGRAVGSNRNLGLSILATALVAVGFQPVRERVQRFANRVVYGKRATPYEVLSEFSGGMSHAIATEEVLPRLARIVAEGMGAAEVTIWLNVGTELVREASWPPPSGTASAILAVPQTDGFRVEGSDATMPVRHRGELLGMIGIKKSPGDPIKPAESKLLEDLASQAGLVLRNVRLIEDLKKSRQRLVTAQDEERRRLERDLHDGAQQRIVSIALALRLARRLVPDHSPDLSVRLDQASDQLQLALSELREFARGIHPAILTERGIVPALESLSERSTVPATVEASVAGRLPAPVEATAYFVASEALANVGKYSKATHVTIRVGQTDGALRMDVTDDGIGGADPAGGSGLRGLADRVAVVDGSLEVVSPPGEGTRITIRIPVPAFAETPV